jgi:signal transduction histidine kinase/AraC-like DNA-binding protein
LLSHIRQQKFLPEIVRVDTRLITRESCGCNGSSVLGVSHVSTIDTAQQIDEISAVIIHQARNLKDTECRQLCQDLLFSFFQGIEQNDQDNFVKTLIEVLQQTTSKDDDAYIWNDAVSRIYAAFQQRPGLSPKEAQLAEALLDQARLTISTYMQHHHRRYLSHLAWVSNRLSLLTAGLLTALDENQIFKVLATHLPAMDIQQAYIALYEPDQDSPTAWSEIRDVFNPADSDRSIIRICSQAFPPAELISEDRPYQLTLIPFAHSGEQLGYMIFDCQHIELYGAIVQQIGGALNTARLYREATEGRKLAEEANRLKSRLLSLIVHELRTPLNLIVGLSEIVLKSTDESSCLLPETTQKDIEQIYAYSQHLGGLVGDVLDLATSDAGQLRLINDFVDLGQAYQLVCESGRQMAADKGLAWEADIPDSGPWVWGDRMRLRQVALNLINNAIKFTDQGKVTFRLDTNPDNSVTIWVTDTGLGISQEDQQVIFNEFRQSDKSVMLGYGGLGLGLAISKRLIELHGGTIGVQSSGKTGAGSTFYFTLPTVPVPAESIRQIDLPVGVSSALILTSHPEGTASLTDRLTQRGIRVQLYALSPPVEMPSTLFDFPPDAILIDVSDHTSLGWEALKAIKTIPHARDLPAFLFKSSGDSGTLLELNHLTKPIKPDDLTRVLDQQQMFLGRQHPTRNILVVDDDLNTLELNARIVQSHSLGNHVFKAHNGREALKILADERVDLILLDLQMPQMDGFTVIEYLREHEDLRKIPVIVVTGVELTESDMERLNRGVATILEKGLFSLDETVERIAVALERKRRLSGEAQRLVRKAMAYIHEHYAEPIARHDIAQYVNVSDDHLTFCFRQELGATPIDYLQRYRVHQARQLLKDSERSISEIALDVGFTDSGYFSRIFRRITGMSPESFRRSF